MTSILVAFDSFKGSLTALEACQALEKGLNKSDSCVKTELLPLADGGEGTLDCLHTARSGNWLTLPLHIAAGYEKSCKALLFGNEEAAMEVAEAVGIIDLKPDSPDVMQRHSGPAGIMLNTLIEKGSKEISIGLGGSCTSDGGLGLLSECGYKFYNHEGHEITPFPENLNKIETLSYHPKQNYDSLTINMLNDVENPLCGPKGACAVYGPQKGLQAETIEPLDQQIHRIYQLIEKELQKQIIDLPGAGAAGGLGAALYALGAKAKPGAEVLIELTKLEEKIKSCDLVITGEGRSDSQTLEGKLPKRIADMGKKHNVPVALVSGGIDIDSYDDLLEHFQGVFSISNGPNTLETAILQSPKLLEHTGQSILKLVLNN